MIDKNTRKQIATHVECWQDEVIRQMYIKALDSMLYMVKEAKRLKDIEFEDLYKLLNFKKEHFDDLCEVRYDSLYKNEAN